MRHTLKQKLQSYLAWATRRILAKYRPKVVGITGSVGKTSTKEAVYAVLSQKYRTRKSDKNYNNEFGVPLTVIGSKSPEGSAAGWIMVSLKALGLVFFSHRYPQVLVLEMGIDRPGDMDYLVSLARPDVAVVTTIGMSHRQFFTGPDEIEHEKGKIVEAVAESGFVVLNADNEPALRQRGKSRAKVITYGRSGDVTLLSAEEDLQGRPSTRVKIKYGSGEVNGSIPAVGQTHISAVLGGVAVAQALRVEESLLKRGLSAYRPAPSRLNIIPGIKKSVIIDDSYNAAPDSMREALALLGRMPQTHKIAVLGDMLELGQASVRAHEEAGKQVAKLGLDHLVTVGEEAKIIADSAVSAGMHEEKVLQFDYADEARKTVQNLLKPESAILVKGSQGARTEKVVKEIMAEPMSAPDTVCRQTGSWVRE